MGSRVTIFLSIIAVLAVGTAGYLGWQSSRPLKTPAAEAPPSVAASTCDIQQTITAPGNLVNTRQTVLEMPAAGRLEQISVQPGETVQAGQVLAVLGDGEKFAASLAETELEVLQAEDALQNLHQQAGGLKARAEMTLAEAEKALEKANKDRQRMDYPRYRDDLVLENARVDYALAKDAYKDALRRYNLVDQKRQTNPERVAALKTVLASKQQMDRAMAVLNWYLLMPSENDIAGADAALAVAQAGLEQARLDLAGVQSGPDALDLALAEARLASAEAKRDTAAHDLENIEVRAPFDGVVLEVKATPGESLPAGAAIITLNDPYAMEIQASVLEEELPRLLAGQSASVFFDALPEAEVGARLARIVPSRLPGDRPLYPIYLTLDEIPAGLVAGMTADTAIVTAEVKNVMCLPRAVVRASSGDSATVTVWVGDHEEKRVLQVGLRGDSFIEIISGLEPGELVVSR